MNNRDAASPTPDVTNLSVGWQSLGPITDHRREEDSLLMLCGDAKVCVSPLAGGVIRIRLAPTGHFGRDHSWAIASQPVPAPNWSLREQEGSLELIGDGTQVRISRRPCRISFHDVHGREICIDDPSKGIAWDGDDIRCFKKLYDDDHFFGLGEKSCPLDRRDSVIVNWNTDVAEHEPYSDPLYQTHPFVMCLNQGRAYGVFFDNTFRSFFDLGKTSRKAWSFGADGGQLDYYLLPGPEPADVVRAYARLVGPAALPPRWSLGYQQCRWSYESAKRVTRIAKEFRKREIPCDVIYLDIDYMDGFRCFTWHPKRFPKPSVLIDDLADKGFKVVTIIDPGLKAETGYAAYDRGLQGDHFLRDAQGGVHVGHVWPGESVFPDFTRAVTRSWWGGLYDELLAVGVAGIWNDMNEPADLKRADKTLPLSVRFDNDGEPSEHRECHNLYGMQMARATFEGLQRLRVRERPFVLTRAGYSGVQRFAAVWTGDNLSSWEHLRMSIPMLLNMSLSGIVFCGADIGGFRGVCSPELFTRWLQLGIFYPLCRVHTAGGPEQDPWSYGKKHERINRRTIELRYRLLPYLYTEFHHAVQTGMPILRPFLLDFPNMPAVHRREREFLVGRQLLVAPVICEGATSWKTTLPPGQWYDFADASPRSGGTELELPVSLDTIPLFARAGAIIPTGPVTPHVEDAPLECLTLNIFPGDGGGWFYNDDGRSYDYQRGEYTYETYAVSRHGDVTTLRLLERCGTEGFTPGRYLLRFLGVRKAPVAVAAAGEPLPQCEGRKAFDKSRAGWRYGRKARTVWVHIAALSAGDCVEILHKVRSADRVGESLHSAQA